MYGAGATGAPPSHGWRIRHPPDGGGQLARAVALARASGQRFRFGLTVGAREDERSVLACKACGGAEVAAFARGPLGRAQDECLKAVEVPAHAAPDVAVALHELAGMRDLAPER